MKKVILPVAAAAVVLFSVLLFYSDPIYRRSSPAASKGVMDLSSWDFAQNGSVSLNGEWACYDGQLLTPADFSGAGTQTPRLTGYINLTMGRLNNPTLKLIRPKGVRTYRLIVKTGATAQNYGLILDNVRMSSRLYINGILQGTIGMPAEKNHGYQERAQSNEAFFRSQGTQTEILIQVANYDYPFYGTKYTILLGPERAIRTSSVQLKAFELCAVALCFLFGFFYLCLFLAHKGGWTMFFAACEFFSLDLCVLVSGERLLYSLFSSIPFELFGKIQAVCIFAVVLSIVAYVRSVSRTFFPDWFTRIVYAVGAAYAVFVLLTPNPVYVHLNGVCDVFVSLVLVYLLLRLIRIYRADTRPSQKAEILLNIFCIVTLLIMFDNIFLYNFSWIPYTIICSLSACAFFLLSMGSIDMRLIKSMNETVQNEFAFLQAQIKPHFIYNAINTIVSFCYTDGERAAGLLTNFSQYLRLTYDVDNQEQQVPLRREIDLVRAYVEIERARFGNQIRIEYDIDEGLLDRRIPPLIIQPLVENAIKHGLRPREEGGLVAVSVKNPGGILIIAVKDTGVGMTAERVDRINKRKFADGSVGMINVCRRVDRWENARINFSSIEGVGTTVTITVDSAKRGIRNGVELFESRHHRR